MAVRLFQDFAVVIRYFLFPGLGNVVPILPESEWKRQKIPPVVQREVSNEAGRIILQMLSWHAKHREQGFRVAVHCLVQSITTVIRDSKLCFMYLGELLTLIFHLARELDEEGPATTNTKSVRSAVLWFLSYCLKLRGRTARWALDQDDIWLFCVRETMGGLPSIVQELESVSNEKDKLLSWKASRILSDVVRADRISPQQSGISTLIDHLICLCNAVRSPQTAAECFLDQSSKQGWWSSSDLSYIFEEAFNEIRRPADDNVSTHVERQMCEESLTAVVRECYLRGRLDLNDFSRSLASNQ